MLTSLSQNAVNHPDNYVIDLDLLQAFEDGLDPSNPEAHQMPSRVLGYGEISTVFALDDPIFANFAFKRMSIFETAVELDQYLASYNEYHWLLEKKIGIRLPTHGYASFINRNGRPIFYIVQEKVESETMGQNVLANCSEEEAVNIFAQVLQQFGKVIAFNAEQDQYRVALDGQISNWAVGQDGGEPLHLLYIDTSTPLYRVEGIEQLNPTLFLRPAPSFLRWILRIFLLEDVVNRYYDFRAVIIDLLGNLHKEALGHFIPLFIPIANDFLQKELVDSNPQPISESEVNAYYNEDKKIWALYASMRSLDRFLHNQLFRKHYPYILPGKVNR